jgi:hypothetical protein
VEISTVAFEENQLTITVDTIVSDSVERMIHRLANEPTKEICSPFEASNTTVRITKAGYIAYIPYEVIDILLVAYVTAHHAYELVVLVLVDSDLVEICEPLVESLTLALIKPSAT